jgi:uncharacterized protein (TIGR02246 family)
MSRRLFALAAGFAGLVSFSACAPTANQSAAAADTSKDQTAIATTRANFQAAMNAGDAAKVASFYTADGIQMPDNRRVVVGRDAIQKAMTDELSQYTEMLTLTPEETKVMGDWAYDRGQFMMHVMPKSGTGTMTMEDGKYLVLLQKQPDGTWQIARDMSNSNAMAMPPAK